MDRFHLLEHTADSGIEAETDSREGLVTQTGLGLRWLLYGNIEATATRSEKIAANGNSVEETLVNWLNELLFAMTEQQFVPASFAVQAFTDRRIVVVVAGEAASPKTHRMLREVKAATYHQACVTQEEGHWKAIVYFDL